MSSIFQQTVEEYTKFNNYVNEYKNQVETDPASVTGGSATANEITAIAENGTDANFGLIEHTAWMVNFGNQFVAAVGDMIGSKTSSSVINQRGQATAMTDQNGYSITEGSLANVTSITLTILPYPSMMGGSGWDYPAGVDPSQVTIVNATYRRGTEGMEIPVSMTVTLTGSAMQAFLAQAQASGSLTFASVSTSNLLNVLQEI